MSRSPRGDHPMNARPKVSMLSEKQVRLVHDASLEILEKTGVLYENSKAIDIMEANGQKVDRERGVAWVKPELVERCLKTVPRKFVLASRDGKNDAVIDGEQMHHMRSEEHTSELQSRLHLVCRLL